MSRSVRTNYDLYRNPGAHTMNGPDEMRITQAGGDGESYCPRCDSDTHICPGCGDGIEHGSNICQDCKREHAPRTEDFTRLELFPIGDQVLIVDGTPAKQCRECGALVMSPTLHTEFHNKLLP